MKFLYQNVWSSIRMRNLIGTAASEQSLIRMKSNRPKFGQALKLCQGDHLRKVRGVRFIQKRT